MSFTSSARLGRQFISVLNPEKTLLVCVIVGCVFVVLRSIPLIASPYQIDYGEGLMLDGALRLQHSQPLYPNPFAFPVVQHVYGPVAYGVTRLILPGEGVSFPEGRLLIVMCAVALSCNTPGFQILAVSLACRRYRGSLFNDRNGVVPPW